jgi:hypothetical protein
MKTLLVTYYWWPYNTPGALRWVGLGRYLDIDVLTTTKPIFGEVDCTMPFTEKKVYRLGWMVPAVIWGGLILFPLLFMKYDCYIITSPPESLLFTAWVLQKFGKKVIVDVRDKINRKTQFYKKLIPVYNWFYARCRNIIVSARVVDPKKPVVYHGYDNVSRSDRSLDPPVYYQGRVNYATYNLLLSYGFVRDFSGKPEDYGASSFHTVKHLGYEANQRLAEDEYGLHSWEEGAIQIHNLIQQL